MRGRSGKIPENRSIGLSQDIFGMLSCCCVFNCYCLYQLQMLLINDTLVINGIFQVAQWQHVSHVIWRCNLRSGVVLQSCAQNKKKTKRETINIKVQQQTKFWVKTNPLSTPVMEFWLYKWGNKETVPYNTALAPGGGCSQGWFIQL